MRVWQGIAALVLGLGATIAADTLPATGGNIEMTPIGHAGVLLEHAGKVIAIDVTPMGDLSKAKPADLILITDIHGDHLNADSVTKLKKAGTVVAGPKAVADQLPGTQVIANGETKTFAGVQSRRWQPTTSRAVRSRARSFTRRGAATDTFSRWAASASISLATPSACPR
jgi:L-ascorbate metabolism protein UlaG (beta-lactamase superfamily)